MRPRNEAARARLAPLLMRRGPVAASELARELGISGPSMHRMLHELGGTLVAAGHARRARYALRRSIRGARGPWPVFEVDPTGRAEQVAELSPIAPQSCWMSLAGSAWPVSDESRDGWWGSLPYPLYDMRPQGYMGRQLARAEHRTLEVSPNPDEWGDDDVLHVIGRVGSDLSGSLIVGEAAYERWLANKMSLPQPLVAQALPDAYRQLAEAAVAAGVPGSSAAGEFPKFAARREHAGARTPHVLVKFSGAEVSAAVQRWSDLLVAEHLALACAAALPGVEVAATRIVQHAGRTFVEVERFDRHGDFGRSPLCSLGTVNAALLGDSLTDWVLLARRLAAAGWLHGDDVQRIERLWWYGRLIANSDMHLGNLSFRPVQPGSLRLAPAYDMLPMLYAPLPGGEVPVREYAPALPLPPQRSLWLQAAAAALAFWRRAAGDARISASFRSLCAANAGALAALAEKV